MPDKKKEADEHRLEGILFDNSPVNSFRMLDRDPIRMREQDIPSSIVNTNKRFWEEWNDNLVYTAEARCCTASISVRVEQTFGAKEVSMLCLLSA